MDSSTPTKDRILDAAMRLFSENGFRATSITQIETAAGLSPGAGGIYHHFKNKESLLAAGVARHLGRLSALRDIRSLLMGIGDLRTELTVTARYALAELEREHELLRVLTGDVRTHPALLQEAADQLIRTSFEGFAAWLHTYAGVPVERAESVSAVGLGALLSHGLLEALGLMHSTEASRQNFVATWVDMMINTISEGSGNADAE